MIEDHLKKVKVQKQSMPQKNKVYFQYFKWVYNKRCIEENHLNTLPCSKLLDEKILENFGQIPSNCLHLKSSFYIWRKQRYRPIAEFKLNKRGNDDPTEIARNIKKQYILCKDKKINITALTRRHRVIRPIRRILPQTIKIRKLFLSRRIQLMEHPQC
jgi:hypothetical protein